MKKKAVFWILIFLFLSGCGKATDMQKQSLENEIILEEDTDEKLSTEGTDEKLLREEISEEEQQNVKEEQGFSSYEYEEESLSERIAVEISIAKERAADLEVKLQEISSQSEMNAISKEIYQTWDDALNTVWKLLEAELDDATMEALRIEEREWIKFKEAEVEAVGEEFGAGTIRPAEEFAKAAELTEKRVYELAEYAE